MSFGIGMLGTATLPPKQGAICLTAASLWRERPSQSRPTIIR